MYPIGVELKFIPTRSQYRVSPVIELANAVKQIPKSLLDEAFMAFIQYPSKYDVSCNTVREEHDTRYQGRIRGLTVRFELRNDTNVREGLNVHMYESQKVEFPPTNYPPVRVHLIGDEKAPILTAAVSRFLAGVDL
jgi:hypothetical protein